MNNLLARANESPLDEFASQSQTLLYPTQTKIISTLVLLLLGYYLLSLLDAWPSTLKRTLYELIVYSIPSPLIYGIQYGLIRLGHMRPEEAKFTPRDFGDMAAKQEALRRIFGHPQLPIALRKVRSLSGPLMSFKNEDGPPGLGNWDNSCYQNSILQGLASLPTFVEYVKRSEDACDKYSVPAITHRALVELLQQLADSNCRTAVLWTPRVLKSMDSWQQQDAQEYFSRILEAVEKEAAKYAKGMTRSSMSGLECLKTTEKQERISETNEEGGTLRQLNDTSASETTSEGLLQYGLRMPIEGMTAQSLQCKTCGFTEGLSLTQFNCLTLNLGLQGDSDIERLLNEYTAPEDIEGVECDNCTKLAQAAAETADEPESHGQDSSNGPKERKKPVLRTKAKQITIGRLPRGLVLHINRSIFDNYGNQLKNTAPVRFPMRLEFLSKWCAPLDDQHNSIEAMYELRCVVTHYGSHHDGHYIALGKRDKDWFSFNDERVTKISEDEVLSRRNGFMLFYEAINTYPATVQAHEGTIVNEAVDDKAAEADISPTHQISHRHQQRDTDDAGSQISDEEMFESQSDLGRSSDASTPPSSENSSPIKAQAEEPEKQNEMSVPVMKTAPAPPVYVHDPAARGTSCVPVS